MKELQFIDWNLSTKTTLSINCVRDFEFISCEIYKLSVWIQPMIIDV